MLKVKESKCISIHLRVCFICAVYTFVIWVLSCGCKLRLIYYSVWACVPRGACVGVRTPYGISFLFPLWCGFRNPAQTGSRAFYPRAISCLPDSCCCLRSFSSSEKYLFILSLALNPGPPMSACPSIAELVDRCQHARVNDTSFVVFK